MVPDGSSVALGMALVIGTEGVDLSVGSVMAIAAAILPLYLGYGLLPAIGLALVAGALCGLVNGTLVAVDLKDKTTVTDLLDLASVADGFVGQASHIIPMAEAFGRQLLIVWASAGLNVNNWYVKNIKPGKVLSGPLSRHVMDDASPEAVIKAARTFVSSCSPLEEKCAS